MAKELEISLRYLGEPEVLLLDILLDGLFDGGVGDFELFVVCFFSGAFGRSSIFFFIFNIKSFEVILLFSSSATTFNLYSPTFLRSYSPSIRSFTFVKSSALK